jgi:type IV pilus assembly protein PilP
MRKVALIAIFCLLMPLGACSKDPAVPVKSQRVKRAAPVEVKAQPQPAVETEDVTQPKFYAYDPRGRRDPFLSLVKITKRKAKKKKGASPMESFSVEEIKLLAIASDKDENYALILLPNQKSFTIRKGTALGLEGGKVEEISAEKVVIREYVKDYRGDLKPKDTVLKLHKGED